MKKTLAFIFVILTGCTLGHKEVKYNEMAAPPKLRLSGNEILIRTENSTEFTSFLIYEIQPTFDEGEKIIYLKGLQSMGKDLRHDFRISLKNIKLDSVSKYKIFWVDPDNTKTELHLEN